MGLSGGAPTLHVQCSRPNLWHLQMEQGKYIFWNLGGLLLFRQYWASIVRKNHEWVALLWKGSKLCCAKFQVHNGVSDLPFYVSWMSFLPYITCHIQPHTSYNSRREEEEGVGLVEDCHSKVLHPCWVPCAKKALCKNWLSTLSLGSSLELQSSWVWFEGEVWVLVFQALQFQLKRESLQ